MCLALPAQVVAVDGDVATVDLDGVQAPISLAFLEDVAPGDFVIIHVGYALSKVDPALAAEQIAAQNGAAGVAEEAAL